MSETEVQERQPGHSGNSGMIRGIPGKHIEAVGMLDLRGVSAEDLAQVESIQSVGAVLIDPALRSAMAHISMDSVGAILDAPADARVLIEPWLEFSKAGLEAMPQGQNLLLIGIAFFKPDVPPALVTEKFEALQVVGVVLATAGVQGALIGKMQITGMGVTLPEEDLPLVKNIGQNTLSPGYLSHLADGNLYVNVGQTTLAPEVPEDLLAKKIKTYINVGQTAGPAPLLDLLKARCPVNLGEFSEPEES
ncbi:MAG TPA: hypothetical protein VFA07_01095 [Chthonomonadaceae bacterium]|nr:hypothetical protein [Chthonomonadaceae bacterium]